MSLELRACCLKDAAGHANSSVVVKPKGTAAKKLNAGDSCFQ
jgi:hypothetical protein